jgi:hypothetical protein
MNPRQTLHAPPCSTITLPGVSEGGDVQRHDHDHHHHEQHHHEQHTEKHHFRGIGCATETPTPCVGFPRNLHEAGHDTGRG